MNYLELIPRDIDLLKKEAKIMLQQYPEISGINIPDINKLAIRSYEAADILLEEKIDIIPHIRSIDNPLDDSLEIIRKMIDKGLSALLVVKGDDPSDETKKMFSVTSIDIVKKMKSIYPKIKIYCALDQYRTSYEEELEYCKRKIDAGADGFFTQPFFDKELAEKYLQKMKNTEIFIGISPVTSEKSLLYWKNRNKAIFPNDFKVDLDSNCELAKEIMALADSYNQHTYLMPIKIEPQKYLEKIYQI
jgi:methylenetetrahydrofolate reductase (NADPH)